MESTAAALGAATKALDTASGTLETRTAELRDKAAELEVLLAERDTLAVELKAKGIAFDSLSSELYAINTELDAVKAELNIQIAELEAVKNSMSWKISAPYRFLGKTARKIYRTIVPHKIRTAIRVFKQQGFKGIVNTIKEKQAKRRAEKAFKPALIKNISYNIVKLPVYSKPLVSIVIPVYNQFDYTYKCIVSIFNTVKNIEYEIIIGDDMSTDETKNIKKYFPNIKVNKNKSDHGFLMNCNRAAKIAKGEYIIFLNNDTQVQENWLSSLVTLIESDQKIGMVGSKLIYPNGILQEAGGIIWSDGSGWNYGRNQDATLPEFNYVKEADYISGASIMIRSSLWKEIGGFDERYKPAYCEDSDLAFEVRKHGYKVMYQPASVVVHFEGVSNGKDLSSGLKKYQVENNIKFKEKWAVEVKKQCDPIPEKYLFNARERSKGKKVILIVDHYVPTFDKDAGSKTTFQYIKMFISKGYVVKFIGDNYASHEMEPYLSILLQMGVEVLYGPWYSNNIFKWIEANKDLIDFAYLNRPHITEKYIDFIKDKTNIKIIYYGHDLHFLRMKREASLTGNKKLLLDAKNWQSRELSIMRKSSVVYYPSVVEESAIKRIDPSINVKAINAYLFDIEKTKNVSYKVKNRNGILFVGGFSHSPNVDAVRWFTKKILPKIQEKNKKIEFYIVGSNAPEEIKKLDGNGIIFKGFVSEEELRSLYATCRIVVVPLRYGAGVKGKVIEALFNGLPIITTSIGAEGITGIEKIAKIADKENEFAKAVVDLYNDNSQLEKMGKSSIEFIKENFSIEAAWNVIREDFE